MKKELLIILYKINIEGLTRQQAEQSFHKMMEQYNFSQDEELKENYTIREIWLPIDDGPSDVKIIFPLPQYSFSDDFNSLVKEIEDQIGVHPDEYASDYWKKIIREIKLRKLEKN